MLGWTQRSDSECILSMSDNSVCNNFVPLLFWGTIWNWKTKNRKINRFWTVWTLNLDIPSTTVHDIGQFYSIVSMYIKVTTKSSFSIFGESALWLDLLGLWLAVSSWAFCMKGLSHTENIGWMELFILSHITRCLCNLLRNFCNYDTPLYYLE